jgi:hypothetical protein
MAIETKSVHNVDISKQGIDQRFNESALKYIQSLISKVLTNQVSQMIESRWLDLFSRVNINDSSKFDLPSRLKDKLQGFGGSASEAGASIQYEFEIKSGQVNDLTINQGNSSDSKYALATMDSIRKGDLIIRDLGYFALKYFIAADKAGAYFLSKLHSKIVVFEAKRNGLNELDFGRLYILIEKYTTFSLKSIPLINSNPLLWQRSSNTKQDDKYGYETRDYEALFTRGRQRAKNCS